MPPHFEVIFLGTGTSVGVPALGCDCDICRSPDPKNKRMRCAVVLQWSHPSYETPVRVLIDTPPDLRTQLLREKIPIVDAVVFTHEHADHLHGLDDVRLFPFRLGHPIPIYATERVQCRIRQVFDYAFNDQPSTHPGAKPQLELRLIDSDNSFEVMERSFTPIPMKHGPHFDVLGFRVGQFAYCTDTNEIPPASIKRLEGIDTLVIGALRWEPHPTHFNLEQALEIAESVQAKQTYITHIGHTLDHDKTSAQLPDNVSLAYDGMRLEL